MKRFFLIIAISLLSGSVHADYLDENKVLRRDDGNVQLLDHFAAANKCPQNTHLPTMRELAEYSRSLGSVKILNDQDVISGVPEAYYLLETDGPAKQHDRLYFSSQGYKRPKGELGNLKFWSSSLLDVGPYDVAFYIDGKTGEINYTNQLDETFALRCIPN